MDLTSRSVGDLLRIHCDILEELRSRGILRSANNPASDLAELLFCRAFPDWAREGNSRAGHDAVCPRGVRYQVKSLRLHKRRTSRQLSAIRNLFADPFDHLAGIVFDATFGIQRAAIIPIALVKARAKHYGHTNSWTFMLTDDLWQMPEVRDVTAALRAVATGL